MGLYTISEWRYAIVPLFAILAWLNSYRRVGAMEPKHLWWQQIKKHPVAIVLIALLAVVIVLVILIILGYIFNWDWTGLNATDFTSTPQKITRTIAYQPGKTLWDWLQLLIIPAVLAVAGYVINLTISRGEQASIEQRAKSER